jgi:hypothetical protein
VVALLENFGHILAEELGKQSENEKVQRTPGSDGETLSSASNVPKTTEFKSSTPNVPFNGLEDLPVHALGVRVVGFQ